MVVQYVISQSDQDNPTPKPIKSHRLGSDPTVFAPWIAAGIEVETVLPMSLYLRTTFSGGMAKREAS